MSRESQAKSGAHERSVLEIKTRFGFCGVPITGELRIVSGLKE